MARGLMARGMARGARRRGPAQPARRRAGGEAAHLQVGHAHLLHELHPVRAPDHDAQHVRDVEDAHSLPATRRAARRLGGATARNARGAAWWPPRVQVRLEDGSLLGLVVLHGHLPPTKRHHLAAERDVRVVKRRAAQRCIRRRGELAAQRRREQPYPRPGQGRAQHPRRGVPELVSQTDKQGC